LHHIVGKGSQQRININLIRALTFFFHFFRGKGSS
jgi:hypothetical protein